MIVEFFKKIIKFMKIFIVKKIGFLVENSLEYQKIGQYSKAFRYLRVFEKIEKFIGVNPNYNPILLRLKLELYFLTHNYEYIITNIDKHLESIDKHALKGWTEVDKDYFKMYSSMFAYFSYILLDKQEEADKLYDYMDSLDIYDVNREEMYNRPPYLRKDLEKIFKENSYYQENFPENKLNYLLNKVAEFWEEEE